MQARIDESAVKAGRAPSAVRRLYNVFGQITDGQQGGFLNGPVAHWVEALTTLTIDQGMDSYIFGTDGPPDMAIRRFALEVAPHVRENVARYRRHAAEDSA